MSTPQEYNRIETVAEKRWLTATLNVLYCESNKEHGTMRLALKKDG
jgi:hypothetical protein